MPQIQVSSSIDTGGLRDALDAAGYESVEIVEDGDSRYLDVPEGVDALAVELCARTFYRGSLLAAMRAASVADEVTTAFAELFGM